MHFQISPFDHNNHLKKCVAKKDFFFFCHFFFLLLLSFTSSVVFLLVVQYEKLFIIINICCVDGKTMEHGIEICVLVVLEDLFSLVFLKFYFYLFHRSTRTTTSQIIIIRNMCQMRFLFFFWAYMGKLWFKFAYSRHINVCNNNDSLFAESYCIHNMFSVLAV